MDEIALLRGQIKLQAGRLQVAENDLSTGDQKAQGYMTAVEFRRRQVGVLEEASLERPALATRCEGEPTRRIVDRT